MAENDPLKDGDTYSESETDARREAALKRMLSTPPKPHAAMKGRKAAKSN